MGSSRKAFGNAVPYSFGEDALRLAAAGLRAPVAMRDGLEQHELGPLAARLALKPRASG